ncbi:MAG: hypothetical protein K9M99_10455 [Candidatus Cloacimonetes bacterium]|nr:hypothetical protein [Candidatus Cloacimonadota bacterium]
MRNIRLIFIVVFCMMSSLLMSNTLKEYYHSNYGPVERVVFVFSEYPRYRLREDILSVNLSFLECDKVDGIRTKRVLDNPVISKFTFVPTDAFIGVLINTYDEYRLDAFLMKSGDDYKLVLDIFRHKVPVTPEEALEYADFYRKVNNDNKALYFENVADSLIISRQNESLRQQREAAKAVEEEVITEKPEPKPSYPAESKPAVSIPREKPAESKVTPDAENRDNFLQKNLPDSVYEVLEDIYLDKMLMFSILVVFAVIIIMLIMSFIRRFHKVEKVKEERPSSSFGTLEFQRVTIRRLLANGWQTKEIAKELNMTTEQVEELGRGVS